MFAKTTKHNPMFLTEDTAIYIKIPLKNKTLTDFNIKIIKRAIKLVISALKL